MIGILDSGVGIQNSLRRNPRYSTLSDTRLLITAFKPFVSSWPEEAERGKGLTDVVKIALSNKGFFRVDSCDLSLMWDFVDLRKSIHVLKPMSQARGVRYCFVLIDSEFDLRNRSEIVDLIDKKLELTS